MRGAVRNVDLNIPGHIIETSSLENDINTKTVEKTVPVAEERVFGGGKTLKILIPLVRKTFFESFPFPWRVLASL